MVFLSFNSVEWKLFCVRGHWPIENCMQSDQFRDEEEKKHK